MSDRNPLIALIFEQLEHDLYTDWPSPHAVGVRVPVGMIRRLKSKTDSQLHTLNKSKSARVNLRMEEFHLCH